MHTYNSPLYNSLSPAKNRDFNFSQKLLFHTYYGRFLYSIFCSSFDLGTNQFSISIIDFIFVESKILSHYYLVIMLLSMNFMKTQFGNFSVLVILSCKNRYLRKISYVDNKQCIWVKKALLILKKYN